MTTNEEPDGPDNEGVLDPWVSKWLEDNPMRATPLEDLPAELLEAARSAPAPPPLRRIESVVDDLADGVPVRIYQNGAQPSTMIVYFHGGGFVLGSIDLMDNVARELAHHCDAIVVSTEYRLAPDHPYPAGLDDCETVTRWAQANADRFGVDADRVVVCGESAGGNLAAAVTLRLRDAGTTQVAGQILIYPGVAGPTVFPSKEEFDGLVISRAFGEKCWAAYSGGDDIDDDPYAAPLHAAHLRDLPPALVLLGGCDLLRDEGRAYAARLADDGVDVEETCYPGQPHGFVNFDFPAAGLAFERIGEWLQRRLGP